MKKYTIEQEAEILYGKRRPNAEKTIQALINEAKRIKQNKRL